MQANKGFTVIQAYTNLYNSPLATYEFKRLTNVPDSNLVLKIL